MSKITVELTEDQLIMLEGELETAAYKDDNEQTRAFKVRTLNDLRKQRVVKT